MNITVEKLMASLMTLLVFITPKHLIRFFFWNKVKQFISSLGATCDK